MFYDILLVVFLGFLVYVAAYLLKLLLPENNTGTDQPVHSILSHGTDQVAAVDPFTPTMGYETPQPSHRRKSGKIFGNILSLVLLAVCGWYIYENRASLKSFLPSPATAVLNSTERVSITPAQVEGHTVVDGINWIKIVATGTDGVPFEGWISEMAIQSQPPKENKMADEMMKKLGLPTVRERAESLKKLQKVGKALDTALHQDMSQKEN